MYHTSHSLRDACRSPTGYPETMVIQHLLPQKYMFVFPACKVMKMNPVFPIQPKHWTWFLLKSSWHRNISHIFLQDSDMNNMIFLRSKLFSCIYMKLMKIFICLAVNGEQNNRSEYCCAAQRTKFCSWNVIFTKGKESVPRFLPRSHFISFNKNVSFLKTTSQKNEEKQTVKI